MLDATPLDELVLPAGTEVKEHDLVTDRDVLVGGQSDLELGIRGQDVIAGKRVTVEGDVEAGGDCRLDVWSRAGGDVLVGGDAYLAERVHVDGRLRVAGDLDIADDVEVEGGFDASGWIVIRDPVPVVMVLLMYLTTVLRAGNTGAAAQMLEQLSMDGPDREPLTIPRGADLGDDTWSVDAPARVGDGCRLHGNLHAERIEVGEDVEIFGTLRAAESVAVGSGSTVTGHVIAREGPASVASDATVRGTVSGREVTVDPAATVEGVGEAPDLQPGD